MMITIPWIINVTIGGRMELVSSWKCSVEIKGDKMWLIIDLKQEIKILQETSPDQCSLELIISQATKHSLLEWSQTKEKSSN
jgi:hypothetical protein